MLKAGPLGRRPFGPKIAPQVGTPAYASMFANGEQGVVYDPSNFATMFQDRAGTVAVTAVGQPVGKILDLSGNNNHCVASSDPQRPILTFDGAHYYLAADGIDDVMVSNLINATAFNKATVWRGMKADTTGGVGNMMFASSMTNSTGCWGISTGTYGLATDVSGASTQTTTATASTVTSLPEVSVHSIDFANLTNPSVAIKVWRNKVQVSTATGVGTTSSNMATNPMTLFSEASITGYMQGRLYRMVFRASTVATALTDINAVSDWVNANTGGY